MNTFIECFTEPAEKSLNKRIGEINKNYRITSAHRKKLDRNNAEACCECIMGRLDTADTESVGILMEIFKIFK